MSRSMTDFNIRADSVDVEQIMHHIRARIREKRGVDYTEQQIRELASAKLERFLDPQGLRSDLLEQFRRGRAPAEVRLPNYTFEDTTLFDSDKAIVRLVRKLLKPLLKFFFNPNPLIQALHIQGRLNQQLIEREQQRVQVDAEWDALSYEVMHNLVLELTRLGVEVRNMKMHLESIAGRLDFAERRARALEGIVQYRTSPPPVAAAAGPPADAQAGPAAEPAGGEGPRRRRRRRRGRRGGGARADGSAPEAQSVAAPDADAPPSASSEPEAPEAPDTGGTGTLEP